MARKFVKGMDLSTLKEMEECGAKYYDEGMGKIILRLDRVMADRKISLKDLAEQIGIANVNLSKIKTGKISAIRFSTLEAICEILDCQPGDILEYQRDDHK